ncbi:hypothetical protein P3T76_008019 [Phytophthora citrophthora]|uniref:No apical meristem-associated C-terminal domain-containing protein n=1 Tax=Phytophthora citrophthora TaxID=4793 RepID=A0AAD9LL06_9STRA|nr:hypothetical protein P3T76_008019 [Phytophthora citrophthora]
MAEFYVMLSEFWLDPVKHLDTLRPSDRKKILHELKVMYQKRTGQCFYHMKVWKLLTQHSKWSRVFRPLIFRQQTGNESANYEEKKAAISEQLKSVSSTKRVAGVKRRQTVLEGEDSAIYPKKVKGITIGDATVAPRIYLDLSKPSPEKKQATDTTQTQKWIRSIEGKENSSSPVPAATQKPEKKKMLDLKGSLNDDGDVTQRVSEVHLALAWANICCSCVDMSPRLEESHDWFWFLVSSIYFDLAAAPDCSSDIEQILREVWREMRTQMATFQGLYVEELTKMRTVSRADRESIVSRALDRYWTRNGHWFKHRAAWEVLECHRD